MTSLALTSTPAATATFEVLECPEKGKEPFGWFWAFKGPEDKLGWFREACERGFTQALVISGEIQPGDAAALQHILETPSLNDWIAAVVDSPGGSVTEAMAIGRLLRAVEADVIVWWDRVCASACVFILAAGDFKTANGRIAIHRPFLTRDPGVDIGSAMRDLLSRSRAYFTEMNIPESLAEAMFSIPPETSRTLSFEELSLYRLNQRDLVLNEESDLNRATLLGISRDELNRRYQLFEAYFEQCRTKPLIIRESCQKSAWEKAGLSPP